MGASSDRAGAMRSRLAYLLVAVLAWLPITSWGQLDPGFRPLRIVEILDVLGQRVGMVVVVGQSGGGFEADHEYWRFDADALANVAEHEKLSLSITDGNWDDPWIVEALEWLPANGEVAWRHPTKVAWQSSAEAPAPEVEDRTYFGHPTLGGLAFGYTPDGQASLTWFKRTEGPFMQLDDGVVFERQALPPTDGDWWQGAIEVRG